MKLNRAAILIMMAVMLAATGWSRVPAQETNMHANKDAQAQLKQDHKADKAQAKADKEELKALKSEKVKKADKAQDKANAEEDKANP